MKMTIARAYYRMLLGLYPAEYNEQFAAEMAAVFDSAWGEHRGNRLVFLIRETAGVIVAAARQWTRPAAGPRTPAADPALPPEVLVAQQRTDMLVDRMVRAIAMHRFEEARRCAREEAEARETLRLARAKFGIAD